MALLGKARKLSLREERELLRFDFDPLLSHSLPRSLAKKAEEGSDFLFRAESALRSFSPCNARASGDEESELRKLNENVSHYLDPLINSSSIDSATQHQAKLLRVILLHRTRTEKDCLQILSELFVDLPSELSSGHHRLLAECYSLAGLTSPRQHRQIYYFIKSLQSVSQAIDGYQTLKDMRARSSSHGGKTVRPLDSLFLSEVQSVPDLLAQSVCSRQEDIQPALSALRQVMISSSRFPARGVRLQSAVALARILIRQFSSRTGGDWSESFESQKTISCLREDLTPRLDPTTPMEETVLLLKIAVDGVELDTGFKLDTEGTRGASRDTNTSKLRPDFIDTSMRDSCHQAGDHTFALRVYNLLCLLLSNQTETLVAPLQHSLRRQFFSQELVWFQYIQVLVSVGSTTLATRAADTLLAHKPHLTPIRLLACKLAEQTGELKTWLYHAAFLHTSPVTTLAARGYSMSGLATARMALKSADRTERVQLLRESAQLLETAVERDTKCPEFKFQFACVLAWQGELGRATAEAQRATSADPLDHRASLLLVLVLSAQRQNEKALTLCDRLAREFPLALDVLQTGTKLRLSHSGSEDALLSCKRCVSVWQSRYGSSLSTDLFSSISSGVSGSSDGFKSGTETHLRDNTVGQMEGEAVLSLVSIWKLTGEMFLSAGRFNDARMSFKEANVLRHGKCPRLLCCFGEVERRAGHRVKARTLFETALSIDPQLPEALELLGCLIAEEGQLVQAGHYLKLSLRLGDRPVALRELGLICRKRGDYDGSVELLSRSIRLQISMPIVPFSSLIDGTNVCAI